MRPVIRPIVARIGTESGRTMLAKILSSPAPSIRAAYFKEAGTLKVK